MSTPAYKKRQRQLQQAKEKKRREFDKLLSTRSKSNRKDDEFVEYKPPETYRRTTPHYPSAGLLVGNGTTSRTERKEYTGDLIVGIATMHKSNAVPIMRGTKQAEEISQMGK